MAKICVLTGGGEDRYSSPQGFIAALKFLKHDVWSLGRTYYSRNNCDVELPARNHIEYYSYGEVLHNCPWTPDLTICFDPGGYFNGRKPDGLKSILISTDAHRGGSMLREVIEEGSYNLFANMQPCYGGFFEDLVEEYESLPAFDDRRFSLSVDIDPVCDISFVGQTGLALTEDQWKNPDGRDEVGAYISNLKDRLPADHRKYEFSFLPSYDYAERGELLYRLSQDLDLRIYETLWDERLQLAIQKGRIGFNRSILNDVSIRNFEVGASGRCLLTDEIRGSRAKQYPLATVRYESGLYKPFYPNFNLEYVHVWDQIREALDYSRDAEFMKASRDMVFKCHTWKKRAEDILKQIEI